MQAIRIVEAGQLKKDRGGVAPGDTVLVTSIRTRAASVLTTALSVDVEK